jgi:hypothetical protein
MILFEFGKLVKAKITKPTPLEVLALIAIFLVVAGLSSLFK